MYYNDLIKIANENYNGHFGYYKHNEYLYEKIYESRFTGEAKHLHCHCLNELCKMCKDTCLSKTKTIKSIPEEDYFKGNLKEKSLIKYLNSIGINAEKGDVKKSAYPDIAVRNKDGELSAYIELKYLNLPQIFAFRDVGIPCYNASMKIDKEKLVKQINLIDEEIDVPVYYVFWLDFYCIKGLFFLSLDEIKAILKENPVVTTRKLKEGDMNKRPENRYTDKYVFKLSESHPFPELMDILKRF